VRLKWRLSLSFLAVVTIGALLTFFLVQRSSEALYRSFVFSGDSAKAKVYATVLGDYYASEGSWDSAQQFLDDLPLLFSDMIVTKLHGNKESYTLPSYPASTFRDLLSDRIVIVDERGVIVADTAGALVGTVHPWKHIAHGIPVLVGAQSRGTVLVGSMIDSTLTGTSERYLGNITRSVALSTGISVFVALLLGILFALRITKPLATLARATKSVVSGNAVIPLPERGSDEITDLSRSFNEMTSELRRLDDARKRVIADAAHELRTPVTLIQGTIEGMQDGIYPLDGATLESVHEETLRLARLIDTLRELEIIESGELRLERDGVDVHEMAVKAAALFAPTAAKKSIHLALVHETASLPPASGDRLRLGEVMYNLLSNAMKYTPEGGTVRVSVLSGPGGSVGFSVADSGPGIEVSERAHIFERFYRIDKSRSTASGGRGLGLAIASEIVKAHGGSIEVGSSDLGGALFTVAIPRA